MWFGLLLLAYLIALIYALRLSRNTEVGPASEQSYRFADSNIGSVLGVLTFRPLCSVLSLYWGCLIFSETMG